MDTQPEQQNDMPMPHEEDIVAQPSANTMPTISQLSVAVGILVLIFGASYIPKFSETHNAASTPIIEQPPVVEELPVAKDQFEGIAVSAAAAYVWDVKNQRALYNKNAGTQLPLASITKLMTALVAYEQLEEDARVRIGADAIAQEGDSSMSVGETFILEDLVNLTLITSSNDGAYALASAAGATISSIDPAGAFLTAMNSKAEEIGLSQSYFANPTGLDIDGSISGSYGSARDMAFLMEYLILKHPEVLEGTKERAATIRNQQGAVFSAVNTNDVTNKIPGLLGSKTGFTDLAGGNLVIAYDAGLNRPIIISVLGSTKEGRFSDVMTLLAATSETLNNE